MKYLSEIRALDGIKDEIQTRFKGINRSIRPNEGDVCEMENIDCESYPTLRSRKKRKILQTLTSPYMLCKHDGKLAYADGGYFYYDGVQKGTVIRGEKQFCSFGKKLIIFPDKKYYDSESDVFASLNAEYEGAMSFCDGTLYSESAKKNTITLNSPCLFKEGDAVSISGCENAAENNGLTLIIREISDDKKTLRFYENSFALGSESNARISRTVPDMDFITVNENRLWGCKGNTVYGSKLGDPENFYCFDGIASDSYCLSVSSEGDFTACTSYLGYPVFFKENQIYKLYGSKPQNYELLASASLGVKKGSEKTIAVAAEKLIYLSRSGFCAYGGGIPTIISANLGSGDEYQFGAACSDGVHYYVSLSHGAEAEILCRNGLSGDWYRYDDTDLIDICCLDSKIYGLSSSGELLSLDGKDENGEIEENMSFSLRFCDFTNDVANKKALSRINARFSLGEASSVSFYLMYDLDGIWRKAGEVNGSRALLGYVIPVIPRRAERIGLKISGTGEFTLHSVSKSYYTGTDL